MAVLGPCPAGAGVVMSLSSLDCMRCGRCLTPSQVLGGLLFSFRSLITVIVGVVAPGGIYIYFFENTFPGG